MGKRSIVIFPCPQNPVLHSASDHVSPDKTTTESLNKQLKGLTWKHGDQDIYLYASLESEQNSSVQRTISILLARFIASLILLSGLINFLKFIIQMFYNRQRELVLRKCIGSDIKGLFALLSPKSSGCYLSLSFCPWP